MKKLLVALCVLALIAGCQPQNATPDASQFFGTWSGSDSTSYRTYTFNSDRTFSLTTKGIDTGMLFHYSGTWDFDSQLLKLLFSTGSLIQGAYAFSTFNGQAELTLTYLDDTVFLVKQ